MNWKKHIPLLFRLTVGLNVVLIGIAFLHISGLVRMPAFLGFSEYSEVKTEGVLTGKIHDPSEEYLQPVIIGSGNSRITTLTTQSSSDTYSYIVYLSEFNITVPCRVNESAFHAGVVGSTLSVNVETETFKDKNGIRCLSV